MFLEQYVISLKKVSILKYDRNLKIPYTYNIISYRDNIVLFNYYSRGVYLLYNR